MENVFRLQGVEQGNPEGLLSLAFYRSGLGYLG
jgi:hypothetical protein